MTTTEIKNRAEEIARQIYVFYFEAKELGASEETLLKINNAFGEMVDVANYEVK